MFQGQIDLLLGELEIRPASGSPCGWRAAAGGVASRVDWLPPAGVPEPWWPACWEELVARLAAAGLVLAIGGVLRGIAFRLLRIVLGRVIVGRFLLPCRSPLPGSLCRRTGAVGGRTSSPAFLPVAPWPCSLETEPPSSAGGCVPAVPLPVFLSGSPPPAPPPPLRSPLVSLVGIGIVRTVAGRLGIVGLRAQPSWASPALLLARSRDQPAGRGRRCYLGRRYRRSCQDPFGPVLALRSTALVAAGLPPGFLPPYWRPRDRLGPAWVSHRRDCPPPSCFLFGLGFRALPAALRIAALGSWASLPGFCPRAWSDCRSRRCRSVSSRRASVRLGPVGFHCRCPGRRAASARNSADCRPWPIRPCPAGCRTATSRTSDRRRQIGSAVPCLRSRASNRASSAHRRSDFPLSRPKALIRCLCRRRSAAGTDCPTNCRGACHPAAIANRRWTNCPSCPAATTSGCLDRWGFVDHLGSAGQNCSARNLVFRPGLAYCRSRPGCSFRRGCSAVACRLGCHLAADRPAAGRPADSGLAGRWNLVSGLASYRCRTARAGSLASSFLFPDGRATFLMTSFLCVSGFSFWG